MSSAVAAHGLWYTGSEVVMHRPKLPCGMWNLPRPGIKPMSPLLEREFLTSGPPGKSLHVIMAEPCSFMCTPPVLARVTLLALQASATAKSSPSGRKKERKENEITRSCPTLCDPMACSLPGFSIHGIFQARILEWATIFFPLGSS